MISNIETTPVGMELVKANLDLEKQGIVRVSTAGKTLGKRWVFAGDTRDPKSIADELKANAKKAGVELKGSKLKQAVIAVRRGEKTLAWANYDVAMAGLRAKGTVVPTIFDRNAGEDKWTAKFEDLGGTPELSAADVTAKAKGLSKEEKAELLKALQADLAVNEALTPAGAINI